MTIIFQFEQWTAILQCTLENYALFSNCVNIGYSNELGKKSKIKFCKARCFSCLKTSKTIINFENESISLNVLSTIILFVRSVVKVLKRYCLDKNGLYHAN